LAGTKLETVEGYVGELWEGGEQADAGEALAKHKTAKKNNVKYLFTAPPPSKPVSHPLHDAKSG
jgi:hypothetical protein